MDVSNSPEMAKDPAPERLLGFAQIARETGMSRQAIADFHERGKMPPPDFLGPRDAPLWRRKKLAAFIRTYKRP